MNWLTTLREIVVEARKRAKAEYDRKLMAHVAKTFNDRFTYGTRYLGKEYAWMCPKCGAIHFAKTERSVFTGLQFDACCDHPEGHRLSEGIALHN